VCIHLYLCFQHADVNVNKILIGNKCDMQDQRVVSQDEGETLAKEYNIHFFETSAKQDQNVEKAFITIATDVMDRLIMDGPGPVGGAGGQRLGNANAQPKKSGGCC
jgi:Ras-related protein Rab-8A